MKLFSEKYYFHLDEFQHQVNDIWFNNTLKALKTPKKEVKSNVNSTQI